MFGLGKVFRGRRGRRRDFGDRLIDFTEDDFSDAVAVSLAPNLAAGKPSQGIYELMRRHHQARFTRRDGEVLLVSAPFNDIVLSCENDFQGVTARALEFDLRRELSQHESVFRVRAFENKSVSGTRAYFGHGVFAPATDEAPVCDLQFSWTDPARGGVPITPRLGGAAFSGAMAQPAAWYPEQKGVAIAFDPRIAPAVVSLDGAPSRAIESPRLGETLLYLGRRSDTADPLVEAFSRALSSNKRDWDATVAVNPRPDIRLRAEQGAEDWWAKDGEWQKLTLFGGEDGLDLWFRLTNRNGDCPFVPRSRMRALGGPHLRVRGIFLPKPALLASGPVFSGARQAKRWWLDFTRNGDLRWTEVLNRVRTATRQWGGRYAIFDHGSLGYLGREHARGAQHVHQVAPGLAVANTSYEPRDDLKGLKVPEFLLDPLYRLGRWDLLRLDVDDDDWFGAIKLPEDAPGARFKLVFEQAQAGATPERDGVRRIGLDWLSRAAGVEAAGVPLGLAAFWRDVAPEVTFEVGADGALAVEAKLSGRKAPLRYVIPANQAMPIGPLYIEYKNG